MTRRSFNVAIGLAAVVFGLVGCIGVGGGRPIPLARVDLDRMYGGWYLIATVRNGFEKGMVTPYDVYTKGRGDGIREDFYVRRGGFQAKVSHFVVRDFVLPGSGNASWRVQIFWPVRLPFLVLYNDPGYRYVLFGERNRKLGWIYSRTPTMPAGDYKAMLARFAALDYDPGGFVKFIQTPGEIGQPGFWSEGIR